MHQARWFLPKLLLLALSLAVVVPTAKADSFSFTGNFTVDDQLQLFHFTIGTTFDVVFQTWSWAGGVNADGMTIPSGGFDTVLSLFNSAGKLVDFVDDVGCTSVVNVDPATGRCFDAYDSLELQAGTYTIVLTQYDNLPVGPNLSNGFTRQGQGNFTRVFGNCSQFGDTLGDCRSGHWAVDIVGANSATAVPEPSSLAFVATGVVSFGAWRALLTNAKLSRS